MPTAPIFHFNISLLAEAPYFVKRPEDTVAVAGADVTLDCQVRGEEERCLAYCQICGVIQIHHLFLG